MHSYTVKALLTYELFVNVMRLQLSKAVQQMYGLTEICRGSGGKVFRKK